MNVYECIAAVSGEIAKTGITKDRKNEQQGYKFRGIDDVYNALAPLIAKHGLVIIPRILTREVVERQTKSGGVLNYVTVEAEFDFVSAKDGTKATARSFGEAMDSADKATNKAMSAAYKYTAFQTFCIPTEGDNDADSKTPPELVATVPVGFDEWLTDMRAAADNGSEVLMKAWAASSNDYRRHIVNTNRVGWEAIKAIAAKKDAAKAKPVAVPSKPQQVTA